MSMNRRDFSLTTALLGTAGALGGLPAWAQQAKTPPQEGKDYVKLGTPVNLDTPPGKVEVLEFFWYSCPHCFTFEPMFANWVKAQPEHVLVRRVPIAFQQSGNFVPQQKLFYALEGMKLLDKLHVAVFGAIQNERRRLTSDEAVFEWVKTQSGVDLEEFKKLYGSFSVASAVRRATQLQNDFGVEGVPSLGVAGKYYTDGTMSSSLPRALEVVDYLVEQERKRMG